MNDTNRDQNVKFPPPPSSVDLQIGRPWSVVTPFVYRYEDKKWIDLFFETGQLRLSTFSRFSQYSDEVRGDKDEGFGIGYGETSSGNSIFIAQRQGVSALIFCCTHRLDRDMQRRFERDSAFQITNTVAFANEIARQIPGFQHGLEGSCIYRKERIISRRIDFDIEKYQLPEGNIDMQAILDAGQSLGGAELVLLKTKDYEEQAEYRFLWSVDVISGDFLDINVPLARQYCRRVDPDEY